MTELAFTDVNLEDSAKIGIFIGSFLAGVIGYTVLRRVKSPEPMAADLPAGADQPMTT